MKPMKNALLLLALSFLFAACGSDGSGETQRSSPSGTALTEGGSSLTAQTPLTGDLSTALETAHATAVETAETGGEGTTAETTAETGGEGTTGAETTAEGSSVETAVSTGEGTGQSATVSFQRDIQDAIFTPSCATPNCHAGSRPSSGLNLEAGEAWANIVNVPSTENTRTGTNLDRIEPGRPSRSYLFLKVTGDPKISGGAMPLGGPPLSEAAIADLETWIVEGALDN